MPVPQSRNSWPLFLSWCSQHPSSTSNIKSITIRFLRKIVNNISTLRTSTEAKDRLPENMKQLLELRVTREQSLPSNHLSENATNGPHVDSSGVMSGTKKHLGSPIPESNNLVGIAFERNGEGASEAKIGDLENPLVLIKEKILRLQVAMKDTVAVAVGDAFAKLVQEALNESGGQRPRIGALAVRVDEFL